MFLQQISLYARKEEEGDTTFKHHPKRKSDGKDFDGITPSTLDAAPAFMHHYHLPDRIP